jgi:hypothetical protein
MQNCKKAKITLRMKMTGWDGGNRCCAVAEAGATASRNEQYKQLRSGAAQREGKRAVSFRQKAMDGNNKHALLCSMVERISNRAASRCGLIYLRQTDAAARLA